MTLDRQAQCPSCGAPMTFRFGGARAQVCAYCRFVVARTDRGLEAQGRVADLLELPSPFAVGHGGYWGQQRFEVEGRVQYDRVDAPSAPWQEILLGFPADGSSCWVASAQGRWYATREVSALAVPSLGALRPGATIDLGPNGTWVVQEVGRRRLVSAEGQLTGIPRPEVVTAFADLSGPRGAFGTIDYGDGRGSPQLFLGQQFDPAELRLDAGAPVIQPTAQVKDVQCPTCGGSLPLISERSERVVCKYCGTQSDLTQGHLRALGPAPRPAIEPLIAIGTEGELRGVRLVCCGFVERSCHVEGERYAWREYLLWGGATVGYRWLMFEDDSGWWLVTPLEVGDIGDHGSWLVHGSQHYTWSQSVQARIDFVVGEFYWRVEIGETVNAEEFQGQTAKISRERSTTEVVYSLCEALHEEELSAFGLSPLQVRTRGPTPNKTVSLLPIFLVIVVLGLLVSLDDCFDDLDGSGGRWSGGGYYSK